MEQFANTLTGINKVLYKTSYKFHMENFENATPESAHEEGLKRIEGINQLRKEFEKPQAYVNLATGERFTCTENQLISRHS